MRLPNNIIVIGAGIGGLTAALALLRRGFNVTVYEQSAALKEVGAGIQIGPNGTLVLHALGLKEALARLQVLPSQRQIRHWSTGETWNWFQLGATSVERFGAPHVLMHRNDLHGILADAVRRLKRVALSDSARRTDEDRQFRNIEGWRRVGSGISNADIERRLDRMIADVGRVVARAAKAGNGIHAEHVVETRHSLDIDLRGVEYDLAARDRVALPRSAVLDVRPPP